MADSAGFRKWWQLNLLFLRHQRHPGSGNAKALSYADNIRWDKYWGKTTQAFPQV